MTDSQVKVVGYCEFVKRDGKFVWVKPHYTKIFTHKLKSGKKVKVKGGTQIINRFWRKLREFLEGHWQQNQDRWLMTGSMLKALRHA